MKPNRIRLLLGSLLLLAAFAGLTPARAAYQFLADGGTFATLEINGHPTTYHLSPSTGGTPGLDGSDLGTFSLADANTLVLNVFSNITLESGGQFIFGGRFAHVVYPESTPSDAFTTNYHNFYVDLGNGIKAHVGTNMNINLLSGLTAGSYKLATFALAQGNFSPELAADNNGSNYIASFTVIDEPLPEPVVEYTGNGKVALSFRHTQDTGAGNELFVVGNHPDVGSWNPVLARKLHWTSGNVWTGQVAVDAGWALEYKLITRTNSADQWCNGDNVVWPSGDNLATNVPAAPAAPYSSKTLYYYSGWTNAEVVYQSGQDTNWYTMPLTPAGAGRTAGEFLYAADGIGAPGELLTFVPHGWFEGSDYWDHSPFTGGDYATPLDVLFLQDGNVYNYEPPAIAAGSQIVTASITSAWAPTIPSRDIRIYLPRNYETNTWKSYPVLYMHDGQNIFQPGGIYGCWNAESNADTLIGLGRMRETIIVGIDNTGERNREYIPPTDNAGYGAGTADQYLQFVLNNVMPHVEANYRVLTDPADTLTLGSSFGGVVSMYFGLATNRFGKIGPMSPAFWACTNFTQQSIVDGDSSGIRIYMDCGTDESASYIPNFLAVYNQLLADGYVLNDTFHTVIGCGHEHNEAAWDARLPYAFPFLLNIQDELNLLAQQDNPAVLSLAIASNGTVQVQADILKGQRLQLEQSPVLVSPIWSGVSTSAPETLLWSTTTLTDSNPPSGLRFYRITGTP